MSKHVVKLSGQGYKGGPWSILEETDEVKGHTSGSLSSYEENKKTYLGTLDRRRMKKGHLWTKNVGNFSYLEDQGDHQSLGPSRGGELKRNQGGFPD